MSEEENAHRSSIRTAISRGRFPIWNADRPRKHQEARFFWWMWAGERKKSCHIHALLKGFLFLWNIPGLWYLCHWKKSRHSTRRDNLAMVRWRKIYQRGKFQRTNTKAHNLENLFICFQRCLLTSTWLLRRTFRDCLWYYRYFSLLGTQASSF